MTTLKATLPLIMNCVKDRNIPVKLAGEKALIHLLRLTKGDAQLKSYLESVSPVEAKQLSDYHKRVLVKLSATEEERMQNPDEVTHTEEELALLLDKPSL